MEIKKAPPPPDLGASLEEMASSEPGATGIDEIQPAPPAPQSEPGDE